MAVNADRHIAFRGRVLVGFAESVAAPEAAYSLVEAGYEVVAFARRGRQVPLRHLGQTSVVAVTPPEENAARTVSELRQLLAADHFDAVLPLDDFAVWLCDEAGAGSPVADGSGGLLVGFGNGGVTPALDKRVQLAAAQNAGFACPHTVVLSTAADLVTNPDFPVILKPALAADVDGNRLRRGSFAICSGPQELTRALAAWGGREPMLLQRHVAGTGEGLFGIAGPSGVTAWSAHRRLRMMNPAGSGSSACVSIAVDPRLIGPATAFIEEIGWRGPFMIELLRESNGTAWFMEFNGRLWGSLALARRGSYEYPAWAVQQVQDGMLPNVPPALPVGLTCRHLGRELVHLMLVARGPRSTALDQDWPRLLPTVRALASRAGNQHWYNYRRGSSRVFWSDSWLTVAEALRKARSA
jgi:biotin carboxylase